MSDLEHDPLLHAGHLDDRDDVAPGDEPEESAGHWVRNANLGLGFSLVLTAAAFRLAIVHPQFVWGPAVADALIVLAIAQMGVHLVFFLHITAGPDSVNNVLALAFGLLIVVLLVFGSLWIMANLDHNMLPMDQIMNMQR